MMPDDVTEGGKAMRALLLFAAAVTAAAAHAETSYFSAERGYNVRMRNPPSTSSRMPVLNGK